MVVLARVNLSGLRFGTRRNQNMEMFALIQLSSKDMPISCILCIVLWFREHPCITEKGSDIFQIVKQEIGKVTPQTISMGSYSYLIVMYRG